MKKIYLNALVISLTLFSVLVKSEEPQWLEGVYVNEDHDARAKSLTFCKAGMALYDFINAGYVVEGEGNDRVITLYSNGAFKLKVAENGKVLMPDDDFTKQWLTNSRLKLDATQPYECKLGF
ncbi:TPA: hypothetical protein P2I16_004359 [Aeromonas salmonicida]|nr:hypothetical protein [Aeromonas salmonicida]